MKLKDKKDCIANGLEADGEDIDKMSKHQQSEIILKILDKLELTNGYPSIIRTLIEDYHEEVNYDGEQCEQCGDTVYTYKLEV